MKLSWSHQRRATATLFLTAFLYAVGALHLLGGPMTTARAESLDPQTSIEDRTLHRRAALPAISRCVLTSSAVGGCSDTRLCPDALCCSQYGWCGSTPEYCGTGCTSQCNLVSAAAGLPMCGVSSSTAVSTSVTTTTRPVTSTSSGSASGSGVVIPTPAANAKDWVPVSWLRNGQFQKDEHGSYETCGWPGMVAQTYDDGPHETITPTILDALAASNVKLTFFWLGSLIQTYKAIAQRAAREGHHLASHSWSHPDLTTLNPTELANEVIWTEAQIKSVVGMRPRYFRPPYGSISRGVYRYLTGRGYRVIGWSLDSFDWRFEVDETQILNTFVTAVAGKARTHSYISLSHDINLKSAATSRATVGAFRQHGYAVVPVYICLNELAYQR